MKRPPPLPPKVAAKLARTQRGGKPRKPKWDTGHR